MTKEQALYEYTLRLGDSSLIIGHRLSEWCGHGPMLEEDIALTNIALDLVGQSRTLLDYAAKVEGKGRTEDDIAYLRDSVQFRNVLLAEQPNGDYANTTVRQFFFDAYCFYLYEALKTSKDATFAGFAEKSLKEVVYHLRHSTDWLVRMGDGTEESHTRAQAAVDELWTYTGDMFDMNEVDAILIKEGIAPDLNAVKAKWDKLVKETLAKATLKLPAENYMQKGSRTGKHTEHLGFLLAEMQYMQRSYPNSKW